MKDIIKKTAWALLYSLPVCYEFIKVLLKGQAGISILFIIPIIGLLILPGLVGYMIWNSLEQTQSLRRIKQVYIFQTSLYFSSWLFAYYYKKVLEFYQVSLTKGMILNPQILILGLLFFSIAFLIWKLFSHKKILAIFLIPYLIGIFYYLFLVVYVRFFLKSLL
jgi:hypothetical protein